MNSKQYNESNVTQIMSSTNLIHNIMAENIDEIYDIVLDIGCGDGNATVLLDSQLNVNRVIGIDIREDVIEFAKQLNTNHRISYITQDIGVEFEAIAPELRALEGKVSLIFSNQCLHSIPDKNKENVVKNVNRLLSKGGKFYAQFMQIPNPYSYLTQERQTIDGKAFMRIPDRRTQFNVWQNLFKTNGFHLITGYMKPEVFDMKTKQFIELILTLAISIHQYSIDNNEDNQWLTEMRSNYRELSDESNVETSDEYMIELNSMLFRFTLRKS